MTRFIEPWIIDRINENERNRRQPPAQVPLYDYDVPPQEIPPGWEPDGNGGYRRKEERKDEGDRGYTIVDYRV